MPKWKPPTGGVTTARSWAKKGLGPSYGLVYSAGQALIEQRMASTPPNQKHNLVLQEMYALRDRTGQIKCNLVTSQSHWVEDESPPNPRVTSRRTDGALYIGRQNLEGRKEMPGQFSLT